jgi:hypothetical protein
MFFFSRIESGKCRTADVPATRLDPPQMQRIGSHSGERRLRSSKRRTCSGCLRSHGIAWRVLIRLWR